MDVRFRILCAALILLLWVNGTDLHQASAAETAPGGDAAVNHDADGHDRGLAERVEQLQAQVNDLQRRLESREQLASPDGLSDQARRQLVDEIIAEVDRQQSNFDSAYGDGLDLSIWGWLTYLYQSNPTRSTFWAWEVELSATHSFTDKLAATVDLEFIDRDDDTRVEIEQAFLSTVLFHEHETVLTLGKFNAPFGIEARDFWDRRTGSTSRLFRAMPQDLTGVIVTQPIGKTGLTVQPFVVNGFDQDLANNSQPSVGLVAAWEPNRDFRFAVTNYYGPEMADRVDDKMYLLVIEGTAHLTPRLEAAAQYLYGTTESPTGRLTWSGAAAVLSLDLNERWRAFGRWSYLDNNDGAIGGTAERGHEFGVGAALYLHPHVETRLEYRRDFNRVADDRHSVFAHATFGF